MKSNRHSILTLASGLIVVSAAAPAAEIAKLQNTAALNDPAAWTGNVVPGAGDVMLWNSSFTAPGAIGTMSQLGGNLSVQGVKVTDVGGTRNAGTTVVGFQNTGSANTLTVGSAGIDLSAAFQTLMMRSRIAVGAPQTWNIGNANTNGSPAGFNNNEDLALQADAADVPIDFGGHTVTTTGNGQVTITSGYRLSNGTLSVGNNLFVIQGGSNRVTTIDSNLNLEVEAGGTLRLQSNSGASALSLVSAAPITVNGGTVVMFHNNGSFALNHTGPVTLDTGSTLNFNLPANSANNYTGGIAIPGDSSVTVTGGGATGNPPNVSGNLTGSGNINYLNTATNTGGFLRLAGDNSGYTGTFTLAGTSNNRSLRIASAAAGSAAATWNVNADNTLHLDGVSAQLGTLNGSGNLSNSHASSPATAIIGSGMFQGIVSDGATAITGVTKVGPGTLTLSGANSYTGPTAVNGGTLAMSNAHFGNGPVTVADGAVFQVSVLDELDTFAAASLDLGSSTGSSLVVDFGSFPNPLFAPVDAGDFTVNAPSTLRLAGGNLSVGTFPVVEFDTLGGLGAGGLSLVLPPRTNGSLAALPNALQVTITATDRIRWTGSVDQIWDIDPVGDNTAGTPNWATVSSSSATRYIQAPNGSDSVIFDDTAAGGTVNLTADLAPAALTVNNSTLGYTFTGTGGLTGSMKLALEGSGSLTLANTGTNDFTGGTEVGENSTLLLGDGVTAGGGGLVGTVIFDGDLVLNRPDDHDVTALLDPTSFGTLVKERDSTATIAGAAEFPFDIAVNGGALRFTGGGTLSGTLSGSGSLVAGGGALLVSGGTPNTIGGPVSVTAGSLRLGKDPNVQAIGGDVTLTGTGGLVILSEEQIADTATLNVFGSSTDPMVGTVAKETVANVNVNTSDPAGQIVVRNDFTVTGQANVQNGIYSVASGNSSTVNGITLTSPTSILRIAANTGASTLNVGPGGISASAGVIELKFNTNDQDGILNLGGDLTATGNLAINNAGYNGPNLNVIHLTGPRTFDVAGGATVTVAPDIGDTGSLTKAGAGTLTLTPLCNAAHAGGTVVNGGTLRVDGSVAGDVQVNAGGTLGGGGTVAGAVSVAGTLSPGASAGKLTMNSTVTLAGGSSYVWEIDDWTGPAAGVSWDLIEAGTLSITANSSDKTKILVTGTPANFSESGGTFEIARSANPISGFSADAFEIDAGAFVGTGTWTVQQNGNSIELAYSAGSGTPYSNWAISNGIPGAPPDGDEDDDGVTNGIEFVIGGNPNGGNSNPLLPTVATDAEFLTFVFRRSDISQSSAPAAEYGDNLSGWTTAVHDGTDVIVTTENDIEPGIDRVTVKLRRSALGASGKLFVRLRVGIDG